MFLQESFAWELIKIRHLLPLDRTLYSISRSVNGDSTNSRSLIPRPPGGEKRPGTNCMRIHQSPQQNMGLHIYPYNSSWYSKPGSLKSKQGFFFPSLNNPLQYLSSFSMWHIWHMCIILINMRHGSQHMAPRYSFRTLFPCTTTCMPLMSQRILRKLYEIFSAYTCNWYQADFPLLATVVGSSQTHAKPTQVRIPGYASWACHTHNTSVLLCMCMH